VVTGVEPRTYVSGLSNGLMTLVTLPTRYTISLLTLAYGYVSTTYRPPWLVVTDDVIGFALAPNVVRSGGR